MRWPFLTGIATIALLALPAKPVLAQGLPGPPSASDVEVKWDTGYPKKEGGKLKVQGTATFANGWSSSNDKVTITVNPPAGGVAVIKLANLNANGTWSAEIDLTEFPAPTRMYNIVPTVQAWKGQGTLVYPVSGPTKSLELP